MDRNCNSILKLIIVSPQQTGTVFNLLILCSPSLFNTDFFLSPPLSPSASLSLPFSQPLSPSPPLYVSLSPSPLFLLSLSLFMCVLSLSPTLFLSEFAYLSLYQIFSLFLSPSLSLSLSPPLPHPLSLSLSLSHSLSLLQVRAPGRSRSGIRSGSGEQLIVALQ